MNLVATKKKQAGTAVSNIQKSETGIVFEGILHDPNPIDFQIGSELLSGSNKSANEIYRNVRAAIESKPQESSAVIYTALILFSNLCEDREFAEKFKNFAIWAGQFRDGVVSYQREVAAA